MNSKRGGGKLYEEQENCIVFNYLPTDCLLVMKGITVTI